MTEPKRVHFETISGPSSKAAPAPKQKSIRLELKLFEPNANTFPQFNYSKLCRAEKTKGKIVPGNGFSVDPFEEVDHDVERLAKEFERKYGNSYSGSDSRSMKNSIIDKGAGYDENNGFIDDSEAFDEIIPDEMDTDRGGFYINSGQLQYKRLSNFEREGETNERTPNPRKRILSTSSSEDNEESDKKSAPSENGHRVKKMKLNKNKTKQPSNKLKKADPDQVQANIEPTKAVEPAITVEATRTSEPAKCVVEPVGSDAPKDVAPKEYKTTTVKDMLRAQRDRQQNIAEANALKSSSHRIVSSTEDSESDDSSEDSSSDDEDDDDDDDDEDVTSIKSDTETMPPQLKIKISTANIDKASMQTNGIGAMKPPPVSDTKLPDSLDNTLDSSLKKLIAKYVSHKYDFLSSANLEQLYEIDKMATQLGATTKDDIYEYLALTLSCNKLILSNEVTKMITRKHEDSINSLEIHLQKLIKEAMPSCESTYKLECKRVEEYRAANKGNEHAVKSPRKKFIWHDTLLSKLTKLLVKRQNLYEITASSDQSLDEYVNDYISSKVVPLWSHGWIKASEIRSQFLKSGKAKIKDPKKYSSDGTERSSSKDNESNKKSSTNSSSTDKARGHSSKESSSKSSSKSSSGGDQRTLTKAERKHDRYNDSIDNTNTPSDQRMPAPQSTVSPGAQSSTSTEAHESSSHSHTSNKSKSNSTLSSSSNSSVHSNGSPKSYNKHSENKTTSHDTTSQSKSASDHSATAALMSPSTHPHNHSTPLVSALKQPSSTPVQLPVHNNNNTSHNSSSKVSKSSIYISPKSKSQIIELSESDEAEVIEIHTPPKKAKSHKHKHNKKSRESSDRSISHHTSPASIPTTDLTNDEIDHNQIIHDLKELSASSSSRKSLENRSDYNQHDNRYRVSSPSYDQKKDHYF